MYIKTEEDRQKALEYIRQIEEEIVELHNKCTDLRSIRPHCFAKEWEHGIHILQMCLATQRTILVEYDIEKGRSPFYRD